MRIIKYFITHSFFIAFIASILTLLSFFTLDLPVILSVIGMMFFLVLAAYNVYWLLLMVMTDKRNRQPFILSKYAPRLMLIFLSGLALLDYIWYRPDLISLLLLPLLFTFFYCLIVVKNIHSISQQSFTSISAKTFLLSITWTFTTICLPLQSLDLLFQRTPAILFINRLFFIWMICLIFEMKDVMYRPLLQKKMFYFMMILLLLHTTSVFWLPSNYFFSMAASSGLAVVLFLLSWMKKRSFYFYYFWVDGLLLLYAFSIILTTI